MKKTIELMTGKLIAGLAISAMLFQVGFAQDTNPNANQNQDNTQNNDITRQNQEDLLKRYPDLEDQVVTWDSAGNEYSASYSMNDTEYMTRYDAEGNWLETMQKREWDDNVPENLKMGLSDNAYENYEVDSYWEITESDTDRGRNSGYFFYLKDKDGNTRNIRMDSQGKIINESDYNDPR